MDGSFTRGALKFAAWVAGFLLIIVAVLHIFFVDRYVVANNVMAPTMFMGDEVLAWRDSAPDMGTISVCENPRAAGQLVIGRVVAKPGMTLKTERGQLYIERTSPDVNTLGNLRWRDELARRPIAMSYGREVLGNTSHLIFVRTDTELSIRETEVRHGYFLLGDYRNDAGHDSRTFGAIQPATCRGNVFMRLRPSETQGPGEADVPHGWLDILH